MLVISCELLVISYWLFGLGRWLLGVKSRGFLVPARPPLLRRAGGRGFNGFFLEKMKKGLAIAIKCFNIGGAITNITLLFIESGYH